MSEDYFEKYPEGGIGDPVWTAKMSLYHAINHMPMNVWAGISHMIDYLVEGGDGDEDYDILEADVAIDILVRYALSGWHPRDREPEEDVDRTVNPKKFTPDEINDEINKLMDVLGKDDEEKEEES